jgi:hypothetical protein
MTTEEKLDRLTGIVGHIGEGLDHLTGVVGTLAASIVAHDAQIEGLIQAAEKQKAQLELLQKEWQAYLRTIRPQ